jgi:Gluconate 2-dehydrogenase subunit 3
MDIQAAAPHSRAGQAASGITRRDAVQRVIALMGGLALVDGLRMEAFAFDAAAMDQAMAQGVGAFTAADVALLDEIADTILPETSTPGAKAAKTGAFMALIVTDVYTDENQQVFRAGLTTLEAACRAATGSGFMQATAVQRLALLEALDREQKTATEEQSTPARTRFPATPPPEEVPAHYFRMMKELALLGYFTSEIGYTKAMRYVESPGRFDPDVPLARGDKSWAPHA